MEQVNQSPTSMRSYPCVDSGSDELSTQYAKLTAKTPGYETHQKEANSE